MKQADGNKQPQVEEPGRAYVGSAELKRRLTRSETELRQLRKENRQLREQLKQASAVDDSREVSGLKKRLQEQDEAHKKALGELKVKMAQMPVVDTEQLSTPEKQQTYATGVMMDRDILSIKCVVRY
ncbi:TPA: hypothetical protein JZG53_004605 [Escherichia coli]|uniref:hypothetical protein n=1 Tax=Escherichia coli TaxID=562 RepID=UPI0010CC2AF9|nr:hypothetical protein [Escherichia coli]GDA12217.1 hypothetical protein HmCmsJML183_04402 [Escherichia coli]HAX5303092.1 hypothetical protein [Escherichia coli]